MIRRLLSMLLTLALFAGAVPALAQSDSGEIDIVVQTATGKAPVVLARVMLDGPVITSEFTGSDGEVRFTDVPDGIYRARVFARGFNGVTSENFEVTNGRVVTVTVALAQSQSGNLRTIASEVVKSTATVSTSSISNSSAQRKLSDTLADALGKLSGVTVTTSSSDSDATQTVSLEGQDPSQTQMTLDGIPLNAPGTAGDMRMMNSDLFTGANVSFGPRVGGLAGGVNFTTLQPTLSWQSEFTLSAGSNGKNNYSFGESGSIGKLGIAAMHSYRMNPSLLDGMQYLDASGLDYTHEGDRQQIGSLLKLRYQLSDSQTLTGTYMHAASGAQLVCTQDTGKVPCGYGPGNSYATAFDMYSLMDNALIGDTQVQASLFGTRGQFTHDLLDRFINGQAAPTGTQSTMRSNGFSVNAMLPAKERHTISVTAYGTNSTTAFTPLVSQAKPYTFPGQSATYAAISVNDSIRSNTKLRLNDSIGVSHASNAPSSLLVGAGANWQPTANDSYAFSYNIGGVSPHAGRQGILTDPGQLRIDCNGNIAYGSAPGDEPGSSSSTSARLSYAHRANWGLISTQLYRQVQNDVVLPVEVNGTALLGEFPANYFQTAQNVFDTTCGVPPSTPFGAQNTYFSTPIGNVKRVYEGAHINGYFTLGGLVLEPYYDIQVAQALSGDPRFDNPYAITISGNQLPNVPLHRAGITLDYKAPHSAVEWIAGANYTGANNPQNLPAYTTVDAGISTQLQRGTLTFAASNIFNAYSGIFAGPQDAVPYTAANGTLIPTIARPNTPRQLSVTYTARFGQNVTQQASRAIGPPGGEGERGGRFRRLMEPLPSSPPSDPFAVSSSPMCTADAQKTAQTVLSGLKAYVAQIEAAKTANGYPSIMPPAQIPGVTVTYHGLGSTYALSIVLKQPQDLRVLFGCTAFHVTDEQTAQQRKLYVAPSAGGGMFFRPTVTFMPSVGLYFVRRPPQPGAENFRLYKLPATPPKTPFALRSAAQTCTADMHDLAQQMLAQLQAHFTSNAPAPGWTIAAHTSTAGTWYSLEPGDISAVPAILNCGHVSTAAKADLTKLGWDAAAPPSLNYTPSLGLYLLMPQMRERGRPGAPSPAPSATP
ncbi:MAG TPA: TonB-dependent receptor [Candidatus Baltobacteraceae bacterium]|nr:TonB-dependent receptor [Candidatus Baltobacteraceae bacterium]